MYIAKTYPKKETIVEHTENLIKNLKHLKDIYGDEIDINWNLLEIACLYHDLGKINRVFQATMKDEYVDKNIPNIPHGYLSILFINRRELMKEYDFGREDFIILINAIAHHHKRESFDDNMIEKIGKYYPYLQKDVENFEYSRLGDIKENLNDSITRLVNKSGISGLSKDNIDRYIILKGLLNKIDYAASGHYVIEYPNDFLEDSLENIKLKWGENAEFNPLQEYMKKNRDENIIAIAETGYGKTEAGLIWIGNHKGFFTLPLKSAINQVYARIVDEIVLEKVDERVGLLHSDTLSQYIIRNENKLDKSLLDYNEITSELSIPLTVCTIDQIFDFIYKYVGFERKLATLSYSKVVIDEIQMYSSDLVAYIIVAIENITRLGGKFAIITATFPPFIKDLLEDKNINFKMSDPFLYNDRLRHSIKIEKDKINSKFISSKYKKNKVLVIVNTLKELNKIYDELVNEYDLEEDINVFHSGFIKKDRMIKEDEIIKFGNKNTKGSGIWICTQVAEASLDIDFDILITELSDLNGLFQRMGRCYRSRELDVEHNIYIFDGGKEKCSGIGYVNDEDIYNMSKEVLRLRGNGDITEQEKLNLIEDIYSTNSLKDTKYYKDILQTIDYIESVNFEEFRKKDVIKYFRNINSLNVIPSPVYEDNINEIENLVSIISDKVKPIIDREKLNLIKKSARLDLEKFKVSIPYYLVNKKNLEQIEINEYENLNIYSCGYSSKFGIKHIKENDIEIEFSEMYF